MPLLPLILLFTIVQTTGEVFTSRGLYFYTTNILHYTDSQNLLISIPFGLSAGVMALFFSHRIATALGERRALLLFLLCRIAGEIIIYTFSTSMPMIMLGGLIRFGAGGSLWTIIESYLTAGRSTKSAGRATGAFNATWSLCIPITLVFVGPLIKRQPTSLFLFAAGFQLLCLCIAMFLPARPTHLPDEHPHRLSPADIKRLTPLLYSARWSAIAGTLLLNILVAVIPGILKIDMHVDVDRATTIASFLDWSRFAAFALTGWFPGWHGRRTLPVIVALGMPPGVLLILLAPNVAVLEAGEIIFGLGVGAAFVLSLYYNLLLHNHSVKGAGRHEGFASLGGAVGPIVATGTTLLAPAIQATQADGVLLGTAPLLAAGAGMALWPLRRKVKA
ncbi:MAG: MFS transporter [Planctomycetes bacterium]|nr:MFS transporter [Planctomycetota bacterium]